MTEASRELAGKRALIVGASRGIGAAIAQAFAAAGAHVVLAGRSREDLDAAAGNIQANGGNASAIIINLLAGSLLGAWFGAGWATRLASRTLYRVIAVLLIVIASITLLLVLAFGIGELVFPH